MKYRTLHAPLLVQLEVTWACNNFCRPCYNSLRRAPGTPLLPPPISKEQIDIIVTELVRCKVARSWITGGEPLLAREQTYYLAEKLQQAGISYSLNTNGTLVTKDDAAAFKRFGVKQVVVSLHGDQAAMHDDLTQRPGSWEQAVRGIALLTEAGVDVSVNMIVAARNAGRVAETGRLVKSLGAKSFNANRVCVPAHVLDSFYKELPSPVQVRQSLDALLALESETGLEVDISTPYPWCVVGDAAHFSKFCNKSCGAGTLVCYIGPQGEVYACGTDTESSGNIFEEGLSAPWLRLTGMRDRKLPQKCEICSHKVRCGGGCYYEGRLESDRIPCRPGLGEEFVTAPAPKRNVSQVAGAAVLVFPETTRLRSESFGGVIYDDQEAVLLDGMAFGACEVFQTAGAPFSIVAVAEKFKVKQEEVSSVFSRLVDRGLVRAMPYI